MQVKARLKNIDFAFLRHDFPVLQQTNRDKPLVFLDSAASAQKPRQVIEAMSQFYLHDYANIHRGIYELSERATDLYEAARITAQQFIHAAESEEIVFVSGATEGINLVATAWGNANLQPGDEIILSEMEHHANIVPWYQLKQRLDLKLKIIPMTDSGELDIDAYKKLFSQYTKLVAITHASNVLGTINPVKDMVAIAHTHGVPVLVDGAQAAPHLLVDVQDLDCDFYVFSAHKLYGPTGIGVLYAKRVLLEAMPPYQGGGNMIETVSFNQITYAKPPQRFSAGTPNIAGAIGFKAAMDYVTAIGMDMMSAHEQQLLAYAEDALHAVSGLRILGTAKPKLGVISFVIEGIHPHDIGTILDHEGIAVRAGHHCAMPLMERLQVPATVRASIGLYNNEKDIDALVSGILLAKRLFS